MQEPVVQFVIPMAGAGSRFQKAGYKLPKPLIPVLGKPMIQLVVENLTPKKYQAKFVFLVQQAHIERYHVDQLLQRVAPGCGIPKGPPARFSSLAIIWMRTNRS